MKDEGSHNQSLAPSFASFSLLLISKLPSSSFLISGNSYRYWNAQKEHKLHLLQAISYNIEELLAFLLDYLLWNEQVSQTLSHLRLPRYFSRFLCSLLIELIFKLKMYDFPSLEDENDMFRVLMNKRCLVSQTKTQVRRRRYWFLSYWKTPCC